MAEHIVKCISEKGNGSEFIIMGTPEYDDCGLFKLDNPYTTLWLHGMESECNSVESIMEELHRVLYDEYQISDIFKEGDTILFEGGVYYSGWGLDRKYKLPRAEFKAVSFHIIKVGKDGDSLPA